MSVFGFSTEPSSGGDWLPIATYDARAGRLFRIDWDGTDNVKNDITNSFKAVADFENVETGWISFQPNTPPSFVMVPMGNQIPDRPSDLHKNGVRFLLKLAKACGGDKPVREIASSARVFLAGLEAVYLQYQSQRAANPGMLPVLALEKTTPVTTGQGQRSSTNYQPTFKIINWVPRPVDLIPQPRGQVPPAQGSFQTNGSAPATGAQRAAPPPQQPAQQTVSADDFG